MDIDEQRPAADGQSVAASRDAAPRHADGKGRRRVWGLLAGLGVFALVALPAGWFAYFSLLSFMGCFIECSSPEPGLGLLWGSVAVLLLALPVATGLSVARVPLRRGWPWLVVLAGVLALGATYAQRVA